MSEHTPPLPIAPPNVAAVPFGDADGAVIVHAGRYARECVLLAFEMIGGVERLAAWATDNPGEFYTKLFPKVITREVEVSTTEGVEDLLAKLDRAERRAMTADGHPTIDGEFTIEDDG